jgi:hypothetical protein
MTRTLNSHRQAIQGFVDLLATAEIAIDTNPALAIGNGSLVRLTWPSTTAVGELFREPSFTLETYRGLIAARAFTAVLYDGGLLQVSYDFAGNTVVGHRLAFVPSPFDFDRDVLTRLPLLDAMDEYASDLGRLKLRSPIRFDYDLAHAAEEHAAVHATIISPACRWPVVAPLSLGHFVRFVFLRFYPALWSVHRFLREVPHDVLSTRTITLLEEQHLHIAWRDMIE